MIYVLGIETSCDETAASVVCRRDAFDGTILSNIVYSQEVEHAEFGGVVPEIAARAHVEILDQIIARALKEGEMDFAGLDAVAATSGPGLIGGLIVGMITAKTIALVHEIPFIGVNHLEGHALTIGLTDGLPPPYLLLLISGGHTQLLIVHDVGRYERLGTTLDDALGEAFDKTAKLLGLGFPGGPAVEQWSARGDPHRLPLPRPMIGRDQPDFSFSGLKTALRQCAQKMLPLKEQDIADLCASFEASVVSSVEDRVLRAMEICDKRAIFSESRHLVVAGGVAANQKLRQALSHLALARNYEIHIPAASLCTDNAAMIGWAGAEQFVHGRRDPLDLSARARWPLDRPIGVQGGADQT